MAGRPNPEAARRALEGVLKHGEPRTPQEVQAHELGAQLGIAAYNVMEKVERWVQERRARRNGTF